MKGAETSGRASRRPVSAEALDLKAAVAVMSYALPYDFDLTMRALSAAAQLALQERGR
jgi:hypothetical protein